MRFSINPSLQQRLVSLVPFLIFIFGIIVLSNTIRMNAFRHDIQNWTECLGVAEQKQEIAVGHYKRYYPDRVDCYNTLKTNLEHLPF